MRKKSKLCLTVTEPTIKEAVAVVDRYKKNLDMVELRADYLADDEIGYASAFPRLAGIGEVILTIRREIDGGKFRGGEGDRVNLFNRALKGDFSFVDLESDFFNEPLERKIRDKNIRIIRSLHYFKGLPPDMSSVVNDLAHNGKNIPKLAVYPKSTEDLLKIFLLSKEFKGREKIILGMGDYGISTRILAEYLGNYLTFVSSPGNSAAPGHIDIEKVEKIYRFKELDETTKILGVIGNPIMHTLSPLIHNTGIKAIGVNAVYLPFMVDKPAAFMKLAEEIGITGFSVTVPHKVSIIRFLDSVDDSVKKIGACNTVYKRNGKWFGTNTDADGFIGPIKNLLKRNGNNLKASVIGAGGAAMAVVYALWREGISFLVLNRTVEKAKRLGNQFGGEWAGLDEIGARRMKDFNDLIVQATKVGMEPDENSDPFPMYKFTGNEIVYDLVYKPEVTKFLERARSAGCRTIGGKEMLFEQAKRQFKIFIGRDFPLIDLEL